VAYFANTSMLEATIGIKDRLAKEGIYCDAVVDSSTESWVEDLIGKLDKYGVLLLAANSTLPEPKRIVLGDALAAFVERGNCVILSAFFNSWIDHGLGGRWMSQNYNPIQLSGALCEATGPMETYPHEVMKGVSKIVSGYYQTGGAHPEANVIALYSTSSAILSAELEVQNSKEGGRKGLVLSLNAFLPNSPGTTAGWPDEPDNDLMLWVANGCRYALRRRAMG